jgi:hypothetical protein
VSKRKRRLQKGQSLVEFVLFAPVLLVLIAGVVEVGAVLNTKLTVVNSAREGARFGVVGASDEDITSSTQIATSNLFNYKDENANIYVIHAKTGGDARIDDNCPADRDDADSYWCVNHTVGDGPDSPDFVTREQVEAELNGADTDTLGVAVVYDHKALLGLPFISNLIDEIPTNGFTLMRVESGHAASVGCPVYPMAIRTDLVGWPNGYHKGYQLPDIVIGGGAGNFGWLRWNNDPGSTSQQTLEDNLQHPNNSITDYQNPADPDDTELNVGDWTPGTTGWMQSVTDDVTALRDRYIRIVIFDTTGGATPPGGSCSGSNCSFHVAGYAIVQINGDLTASDKTLRAKFIRIDTSCE